MSGLLALLFWLIVWLLIELRKKCIREGRPFFRLGKRKPQSASSQVSQPQRANFHHWQHSDNFPKPKPTQVKQSVLRKLNSLTHDPATSNRLVQSIKAKNPQKSLNWCAEQAVWNIERDRR